MRDKIFVFSFMMLFFFSASCQNSDAKKETQQTQEKIEPIQTEMENGLKKAYFASGCFWCVEAIYESVDGVDEAVSGYAGGHTKNPTYEETNTGRTGHAETVEVYYDPEEISFKELVEIYFNSQDITQENGQGPDIGSQYRSIVFYQNNEEKEIIEQKIAKLNRELKNDEVAAEVQPFQKFWKAEGYHQDYKKKNPNDPYIKNVSDPRLQRFKSNYQNNGGF